MNIDELDIAIFDLLFFHGQKKKFTSTEITKKVLNPQSLWELRKFNTKLRYRLEKWVNAGLIKKEHKGCDYYFVNYEKIVGGQATITVCPFAGGGEINILLGKTLLLQDKDRYHIINFVEK